MLRAEHRQRSGETQIAQDDDLVQPAVPRDVGPRSPHRKTKSTMPALDIETTVREISRNVARMIECMFNTFSKN